MIRTKALDIVCIGCTVVDSVGLGVDGIPDEGSMTMFDRVELHLGGCALNVAVDLAKMGLKTGLLALVGADGLGDFCVNTLAAHGVDIRGVKRSTKDSTSFSFIIVPKSGNRRILHTLGANAAIGPKDIDYSLIKGAKWAFFGGLAIIPSLEGRNLASAAKAIKKLGVRVAADTAVNKRYARADWERMLEPAYEYFDIFFPSEEEAHLITGETDPEKICTIFRRRGVKIAGVKLGDKGSAVMSDEGFFRIPVYTVKCVDTLGAGDAFMSGMLAGMFQGYSPSQAARLGNAVAAHCVQAVGATTGIKPLKQILAFQKKHD
ncbi:MAG: carbohydrate kinase family protein [Planctomycetota bacterium]|nr:carbohydrate kinase family protein [Planctomycetota bacterium]